MFDLKRLTIFVGLFLIFFVDFLGKVCYNRQNTKGEVVCITDIILIINTPNEAMNI